MSSVADCLREVETQQTNYECEIIVVDNSTDNTTEFIASYFPGLTLITAPPYKLIPELWKFGIEKSVGDLIVLTTTHFVPESNWLAQIISGHKSKVAGIGGAIENDPASGLISWAVYFCRYSQYMLPFVYKTTNDFAADNASYKREALEQVETSMTKGFWEVYVHQAMTKKNMQLTVSPEIVVKHRNSFSFSDFMRQRFLHGKQFGNSRSEHITFAKRIFLILLSPLIPFLYLYRIALRIFSKKRNIKKLLLSAPILFLFLISWSIGEFYGYLSHSSEV